MTKPVIVTRAGKGSALTWTEGDSNLTNLQNATVSIKAGSAGTSVVSDLNGEITFVAGTNITLTGDNTAKTVTIDSTASGGASALDDLTDVVITAAATNDALVFNGTNWVDTALSTVTVGTATSATNATNADNILLTADATNATRYVAFAAYTANGDFPLLVDTGFSYNPATNGLSIGSGTMTASSFSGSLIGASSGAHNGSVGATTPNTGAFTTLTASSTVSFQPASANVVLTPTGTGVVTIAPATAGTINNMSIGATTASTGRFTTVTSTIATGTAPFTVTSTTKVTNLNVEQVDGYHADTANTVSTIAVRDASGIITASGFAGALNGSVGATTPSTGVFTNLTSTGYLQIDDLRESVYTAGATTGTITPDVANGTVQKITLTGSITFNAFANPVAGQSLTLIVTQSAGGSNTLTSTMKFSGGAKTLSTTGGAIDIITVFYDGTTYYASLAKAFA